MIILAILVFAVSALEIRVMRRRKQNKEIITFCAIAVLSLLLGYFYLSDPYQDSLAQRIFSLFGKEF